MIDRPTILITSLGRTGTEFFSRFFAAILPGSTSLHEPDIVQCTGVENKWGHYLGQVRRAGVWRMGFQKGLGKWTLVKVSDAKFLGRLDAPQATRALDVHRRTFIQEMPGSVYVEANIGYYGLLDVAPQVFRAHKAAYFVRDGRDWIRSHMNWGEFYGKKGIRKLICHNWPGADGVPNDPYRERWHRLSRFEKLCWAWTHLNEYALASLAKNPDARVFHFERLFLAETRYEALDDLVGFVTALPGIDRTRLGATRGWLEQRSHRSPDGFPAWRDWTNAQRLHFDRLCAPLMARLGYRL